MKLFQVLQRKDLDPLFVKTARRALDRMRQIKQGNKGHVEPQIVQWNTISSQINPR